MRDTKRVLEFLSRTDIKAGRKPKFADYRDYADEKREIYRKARTLEEYDSMMKAMIERRGI